MAVPQDKAALLAAIDTEFRKLCAEIDRIPPGASGEASMEGHAKGTTMRPHDLVAYLVGWNALVLKWHETEARGAEIDFPDTGFKWNELGRLALSFHRRYADVPFAVLVEQLRDMQRRIVALVDSRDEADLYGRPWYGKWTRGRMIQFNTSSPYANARGRLRTWRTRRAAG